MLMPNATDMMVGRDLHLARPEDVAHGARREAFDAHRTTRLRRLVRSASHLVSAVL